ncbi:hypothetical protein PCC7424_4653 [Gloeothece citriformis PCC 7424]|uniref:Glutamine synthetase inactivating factor IF7 n=1 Tax=Gloeothece citriformis (strain PCC 7424) TaxID=65393 RepID=B7KBN7_GLOC7|nr:hypothetical protein [Gloeothece citriformis]ACK73015.1 hypothetical protein PCC7424_4653 [Gloeothece citriformis PCC 7424]
MKTQEQARALMTRHQQMLKNRQRSILERSSHEIGLEMINPLDVKCNMN